MTRARVAFVGVPPSARRYKNSLHAFRTIAKEGGVAAFSSGLLPCMLRAFPANAACFFGMELSMSLLTGMGMD